MKQISVIGSISMDLVVESKRRPGAGETVIGDAFHTVPGGKGRTKRSQSRVSAVPSK